MVLITAAMKTCIKIFILGCALFSSINGTKLEEPSRRIVCYYSLPNSPSSLMPQDVDAKLCTHILIGFFYLQNNSISISKVDEETIENIIELKKQNPILKVMISLGGGGGPFGFPEMVRNSTNRAIFIQSVRSKMNLLTLDGIDLDWEFPDNILENDRGLFIELLKDMRSEIENSTRKYILSVAVAAPITIAEVSYNVPEINRLVDFVNVMSYDYNFFSALTPWTGMNAPLYPRSKDILYLATQNINFTSHFWVKKGMNKDKLNIGIPVYAHTYTLKSPEETYLGAPAIGDGRLGSGGSASYGLVCDFMKEENLTSVFDEETKSPYVTNGSEWVSFENSLSMKLKAEFVRNNNYGGVMIFSLSADDYDGRCDKGGRFANTRIIHDIFTK